MKTYIFPVLKMANTKGHIRVQASTLEEATDLAQQNDQERLSKGFIPHYSTSISYQLQPHSRSYQELLGDNE